MQTDLTTATVLIVEDEPALLRGLKDNFVHDGYAVVTATDGEAGYEAALLHRPDLIVLDIMLPRINGYEVCRLLRKEGLDTPILMLTAKGEEQDIVLGLNLGADDYMTKPFGLRELLARAQALLRRRRPEDTRPIVFERFTLDLEAHRLLRDNAEIELTPKEFALLALLAAHPGRALSRAEILRQVWGYGVLVTERSVDRCVTTLRHKIESDPAHPRYIHTVRDLGYRFEMSA